MRSPAVMCSPDTSVSAARSLIPDGDLLIGQENRLTAVLRGRDLDEALRKGHGEQMLSELLQITAGARPP